MADLVAGTSGDSDDDTTDDSEPVGGPSGTSGSLDDGDDGGGLSFRDKVLGVLGITSVMLGTLQEFLNSPTSFIRNILEDIIYKDILLPAGQAIWDAGVATIDTLVVIIVGSDYRIGLTPEESAGLVDVPFFFWNPMAAAITGTGDIVIGAIETSNQAAASQISQFGIAAPTVVNTLWVGEIVISGFVVWVLLSSIDIPVVRVKGFIMTVTAPIRRILRWFL